MHVCARNMWPASPRPHSKVKQGLQEVLTLSRPRPLVRSPRVMLLLSTSACVCPKVSSLLDPY